MHTLSNQEILALFLVSGVTMGYVVAKFIDWLWSCKNKGGMHDS